MPTITTPIASSDGLPALISDQPAGNYPPVNTARTRPQETDLRQRVAMTLSCHDCDYIPKVPHAGEIIPTDEGQSYQLMHNGVKVIAGGYNGHWMAEIIRGLKGHHEPQEEKVFYEVLKYLPPEATMIELGASWGYYSSWFQKEIPNATNYLVEPDPNALAVGKANFALNGMTATFIQACIGQTPGSVPDFFCESDGISRETVRLSVDAIIATQGIDHVDMLHADIQGAELEMLYGCTQSIADHKIRFIFISTHHHSISHDPTMAYKCVEFLQEHGAHIIAWHSVGESYSGDGLIVASFSESDRNIAQISVSPNLSMHNVFLPPEFELRDLQVQRAQLQDFQTRIQAYRDHWKTLFQRERWYPKGLPNIAPMRFLLNQGMHLRFWRQEHYLQAETSQFLESLQPFLAVIDKNDPLAVKPETPSKPETTISIESIRLFDGFDLFINADLSGGIETTIRADKTWEADETAFLKSVLKPGSVFLDVGANIGYFTMLAAHRVGNTGKIIAVEPDTVNATILGANVACAPYPENILLLKMAAGSEKATTQLYRSPVNSGDHRMYKSAAENERFDGGLPRTSISVRVERLDDMLLDKLDALDVVKMDTQGFEVAVLRGMIGLLEKYRPTVLFEFWPYGITRAGHDIHEIPRLFADLNYELFKLTGDLIPLNLTDNEIEAIPDGEFYNVVALPSLK